MRVAEISSRRLPLAIARCGYSDWHLALGLLQFLHQSAKVHFSARFSASHYNLQGRREIFVGLYWRPLPGLANWKWNVSLIESTGQLHRYHLSGFVLLQPRVVLTPSSLIVTSDEGTYTWITWSMSVYGWFFDWSCPAIRWPLEPCHPNSMPPLHLGWQKLGSRWYRFEFDLLKKVHSF